MMQQIYQKNWMQVISKWRKLSNRQKREIHIKSIPLRVVNSMALEGDYIEEEYVKEVLNSLLNDSK